MTIKEAQQLVNAWNDKHAIHNSELTSLAILTEKIGELASAIARKQSEATGHHPDAPNPPLSEEISDIFWEILGLSSHVDIELTEELIATLERRNREKLR